MKTIKKNVLKIINSKYFPFIVMAILLFGVHLFTYSNGDDDFFRIQLDNKSLLDFLIMRYNTWSSRIIIEGLNATISRFPLIIWQIMDTLIFTSIGIVLSKILNPKNKIELNWVIICLLLIYPFTDMSSAGYICTSISYVWTMASLLYILYIFKKSLEKTNIKIYEYLLSYICLLITICFEQTLCLFLGFTAILIFYEWIIKKEFNLKKQGFMVAYFLLGILMLIVTLKCPGNDLRYLQEVDYWYPAYKSFGLLSKIYLGIVPTMSVLIRNKIIVSIFSGVLLYTILKNNKNTFIHILAIGQFTFFLLFGLLNNFLFSVFPSLERFHAIMHATNVVPTLTFNYLIPLGISILILLICAFLLYIAFDKKISYVIIFCASIASRFIMGFSPTVFASVDRTAFFMYIGLIIITFALIKKIIEKEQKSKRINYCLVPIALFNILNEIYTLIIIAESL